MSASKPKSRISRLVRSGVVAICSLGLTAALFLILPVMQAIAEGLDADTILQSVETAAMPPPPSDVEEPIEPEPEEEEPPPELAQQELPPLDLGQLDLALAPTAGDGWGAPLSFHLDLAAMTAKSGDSLFSIADLDQEPRVLFQANPILDSKLRKRVPAAVHVVFVVDEKGRINDPKAWKSSDPIFEPAALSAVKQWKFEPGKRNGQPVRFRMRVTITFPDNR